MQDYILILLVKSNDGFEKLVISRDKLVIGNRNLSIDDLTTVIGEITDHVRIERYSGSDKLGEEVLPMGRITFKFKNGEEITGEAVNPFVKLEELIIKLNLNYRDKGLPRFRVVESSVNRIVYSRG